MPRNNPNEKDSHLYELKKGKRAGRVFMWKQLDKNPELQEWKSLATSKVAGYSSKYFTRDEQFEEFKTGFMNACEIAFQNHHTGYRKHKRRGEQPQFEVSSFKQSRLTAETMSPQPVVISDEYSDNLAKDEAIAIDVMTNIGAQRVPVQIPVPRRPPSPVVQSTIVINNSSVFFNMQQPQSQPTRYVLVPVQQPQYPSFWAAQPQPIFHSQANPQPAQAELSWWKR